MTPTTALGCALLLFVPGYLCLVAARRSDAGRARVPAIELLTAAAAISLAISSLVAHTLAAFGQFSSERLLGLLSLLSFALLAIAALRRSHVVLPSIRGNALYGLAPLALLTAFAVWYWPASQFLWGTADEGTYPNAALALVESGGLVLSDPVLTALPDASERLNFGSYVRGFYFIDRVERTGIVPHGFHLFTAFLAALHAGGGVTLMLAGPVILAVLALAGFYLLAARIGGAVAGLAATALLGLNPATVWFSRLTFAEGMCQTLLLCGFGLLAVGWSRADGDEREESLSAILCAAAGLLLGAIHLVKLEFVPSAVAFVVLALFRWSRGSWDRRATWLFLGYAAISGWALLQTQSTHAIYLRALKRKTGVVPSDGIPAIVAGLAFALLAAAYLRLQPRLVPDRVRGALRESPWIPAAAVVVALLGVAWILGLHWEDDDDEPIQIRAFRGRVMYLSEPGLYACVAGVAWLAFVRSTPIAKTFLLAAVAHTLFLLWITERVDVGVTHPHYSRRFLGLTMPALVLGCVAPWFLTYRRRWARVLLRATGTAIVGYALLHGWKVSRPLAARPVWPDTVETVARLGDLAPPRVVWMADEDDSLACRYLAPLRFVCGQDVFIVRRHAKTKPIGQLLSNLRGLGWHPVLIEGEQRDEDDEEEALLFQSQALCAEWIGDASPHHFRVTEETVGYPAHHFPGDGEFRSWNHTLVLHGL